MSATSNHTAAPGQFVSEVRQVELHVKRALELVATTLERRHSKPTTAELVGAAQQLRHALRVLEGLLFGETGKKNHDGLTALGVVRALADDAETPMRVRVVCLQAYTASRPSAPTTTASVLQEVSQWISAAVFALGLSEREAAARLATTESFNGHAPRALLKAYVLHQRAVKVLEAQS